MSTLFAVPSTSFGFKANLFEFYGESSNKLMGNKQKASLSLTWSHTPEDTFSFGETEMKLDMSEAYFLPYCYI